MKKSPGRAAFDEGYYERYYKNPRTRVHGPSQVAHLCEAITGLLDWWGVEVGRVLDVGAGVGLWRDWFHAHRPEVDYTSIEISAHACAAYGHVRADIASFRSAEPFDLVVCQGVLPYLDDTRCARAIENLGRLTSGFLYLEAITARDLREVTDGARTDVAVFARPGSYYRKKLGVYFDEIGCGLHCRKGAGIPFYELEASGSTARPRARRQPRTTILR